MTSVWNEAIELGVDTDVVILRELDTIKVISVHHTRPDSIVAVVFLLNRCLDNSWVSWLTLIHWCLSGCWIQLIDGIINALSCFVDSILDRVGYVFDSLLRLCGRLFDDVEDS